MFLSIIIPIYNAGRYLSQCLDSLIDQDIDQSEYEILCVDDGSTDNSKDIIDDYISRNLNVKRISKTNGGVSSARNAGLDIAAGDWIWFVDADDFVQTNVLKKIKHMVGSQIDRVSFQEYCFIDTLSEDELERKSNRTITSNNPDSGIYCSIFRREIIENHNVRFDPEIFYAEDTLWICEFREFMRERVQLKEVCYFYRQHPESATHLKHESIEVKKLDSFIKAAQKAYKIYESEDVKKSETADDLMSFLRFAMIGIAKIDVREQRQKYIVRLKNLNLFPFAPLKEARLKKAYVTNRTDVIGKLYNSLVMNSTTRIGYLLLLIWNRFYSVYARLKV